MNSQGSSETTTSAKLQIAQRLSKRIETLGYDAVVLLQHATKCGADSGHICTCQPMVRVQVVIGNELARQQTAKEQQ